MEGESDCPMAVKVEKHSQYVILTYFHGDINSMVDAHFSRALSNTSKAKAPAAKAKRARKHIKLGLHLPFGPVNAAPTSWHSFTTRAGEGPGLTPLAYPLTSEGLAIPGQQYTSSLLNLLHNDQGDVGPSSKPELHPSWTAAQGFRESLDPPVGFEPGRHLDKKDLYWY
ncbi:transcription cofactor vestigial-like protein 1 [Brachionichthys hirsutus]|uniref:transcription cofactor vestigial-like protein 1 n=1 Tax=Brachionichthys hirsutus TaxID=412623 RepID=UPI003604E9A6